MRMRTGDKGPSVRRPHEARLGTLDASRPGSSPIAAATHRHTRSRSVSYPPQSPYPVYGPPPLRPDEERTWAVVGHLGGLVAGFLAPLVIWLVFRGRGPYLEDQAKESLNFQITVVIAYVAAGILTAVTFGIGGISLAVVGVGQLVLQILAAVAAGRYEWYRYPVCIRFVH